MNTATDLFPSAGRVLVDALRLHGVDRVFCVPGESYLEVLDALYDVSATIELVVAKHEGAAAHMAEADGKLTGRPGICMVTRGPGATHASVGAHVAQQDSTPLILFVGQVARSDVGRDVFQEVDYLAMFGKMAKWVVEVNDPDRMAETVARAFHVATSDRPGPVVVSLPEDMLTQVSRHAAFCFDGMQTAQPSAAALEQVRTLLQGAQRPLVMVGGSCWTAVGTQALAQFAAQWNLPLACTFRRQDVVDNRLSQYVGHLSLGMNPALAQMVRDADLILAMGTRITDTATDGYTLMRPPQSHQRLIHVHASEEAIGRMFRPDIGIAISPVAAAQALAQMPAPDVCTWKDWTLGARRSFEAFSVPVPRPAEATGVDLSLAMQHLRSVLPSDAIVTNGAGNYAIWLHRFFEYREPHTEIASTCGAMGYGLPAAVAAGLRHREREVVCVAGDGCFLMYPQELATAAQYGANILVLIVNNGMYGTIRMHQEREHPNRVSGTALKGPDYVALAHSFGAYAERVLTTDGFSQALERARKSQGLAVLELVTDPRQIAPSTRLP